MMRTAFRIGAAGVSAGGAWFVYQNPALLPVPGKKTPPLTEIPTPNLPTTRVAESCDVAVVGGGIIGLATAREVQKRFPQLNVAVVEKEGEVAPHQTGHNSGVIHAGMYYEPGSVMARACVDGARMMYAYAEEKNIPHSRIGKLICAPTEAQHHQVEELFRRGNANGVEGLKILNREEVKALEPNVDVHSALESPNTGIIDYSEVARCMAQDVLDAGGSVKLRFQVNKISDGEPDAAGRRAEILGAEPGQHGPTRTLRAHSVITCAGLHMDKVAESGGGSMAPRVVTFRGRYYQMKPEFRNIVRRNVYPVPSGGGIPVGVHFTPTAPGRRGEQMIVGPGACVACDKEGYSFWNLSPRHIWDVITNPGFLLFGLTNPTLSAGEVLKDASRTVFLAEARKLVPGLKDDMVEDSFCGVMAQVFLEDGSPAKDYIFERRCLNGTTLHLRNAPSPAATSSMAIAREIVDRAAVDFKWEGDKEAETRLKRAEVRPSQTDAKAPENTAAASQSGPQL